jgi:hypothetical protein
MAGSSSMLGQPLARRPVLAPRSLHVRCCRRPCGCGVAASIRPPARALHARRASVFVPAADQVLGRPVATRQTAGKTIGKNESRGRGPVAERCCGAQTSTRGLRGARPRMRSSCSTRRSSLRAPWPPPVGSAGVAAARSCFTYEWCCAAAGCLRRVLVCAQGAECVWWQCVVCTLTDLEPHRLGR